MQQHNVHTGRRRYVCGWTVWSSRILDLEEPNTTSLVTTKSSSSSGSVGAESTAFFQRHFSDSKGEDKKWTAKCKLCSRNVYAAAGVNSNFRRHLKRNHPKEWSSLVSVPDPRLVRGSGTETRSSFVQESENKKKAGQTTLTEIVQGPTLYSADRKEDDAR